jgi:hypothetical protein
LTSQHSKGHIEICEFDYGLPKISIFVNDLSLILGKDMKKELTEEQWCSLKNRVDSILNKFIDNLMKVADDL